MIKRIKIFGERNTNTNYMSKLIALNLKIREISGVVPRTILAAQKILPGRERLRDIYFHYTYKHNLGWKHACVKPEQIKGSTVDRKNDICFLTITKNPYSWLLSLHRNPYHQYYGEKPGFEDFLRTPWKTVKRDNTSSLLQNPIELWNIKNNSYLLLSSWECLNITTENIFANPGTVIDQISCKFQIEKKTYKFINYEHSTKEKSKNNTFYSDYYLNERWRDKLSTEAISIINEKIDPKLMAFFRYEIL